jgi:zinc/manganese transport system substrate-binding protein
MPAVAAAVAGALARIAPRHAAYFRTNARRFDRSLRPWYRELARLRHRFAGVAVATTEPVANYLLHAAGLRIRTPLDLQLDIMNGLDPAPQDISLQDRLLSKGLVRAFVYNRQVTDSITQTFLGLARAHHVPVVGVYETMPAGLDYQEWMLGETQTLAHALRLGVRTEAQ